jgi:predicted nucleic acid-binding protein
MPLSVIDTSVALPATLSPRGLARKFWVLLAFGALTYREEHLQLDLQALEREAAETGGTIGGRATIEAMIARAGERRAALAELLPYDTPSDWTAAGGTYLFDEYERKVRVVGAKLGRDIDEHEAKHLRRQVEAVSVTGPPPFDPTTVPALTPDPTDDAIVYTALRAGADLLISDDRHIVPRSSNGAHVYQHEDRQILAVTFDRLLHEHLCDIDWDEIDGAWLSEAYRALDAAPR